jgi:hypothetical protein
MKPGMRKTVLLVGVLAAAGTATPAGAQPSAAPPSITKRGVVQGDVIEGRINRVDQQTRTITLYPLALAVAGLGPVTRCSCPP